MDWVKIPGIPGPSDPSLEGHPSPGREVAMTTHFHFHPHPHTRHPIRWFTIEHPYAPDWAVLAAVTVAALILWIWNS